MPQLALIFSLACLAVCLMQDSPMPIGGWVLFILVIGMLLAASANRWLGTWACHWLGWHLEPKTQGFDGCSCNGTCPRCGKRVLQDSQGNWFESVHQD